MSTFARAADFWWAGDASPNWNTGPGGNTNFSSSGTANVNTTLLPGAADVVRFSVPGAGNLATTLGQDFSLLGLRRESGAAAASVSGNTLTLGASGVTNASGSTLTVGSALLASGPGYAFNASGGGQILVTGTLAGADKTLVKSGPGILTLAGSAGFSGSTTVSAGTLELLRSAGFSVASPISVARSGQLTLPGRLSGTGITTKTGTGTLSFFGQLLPHVQSNLVITGGAVDLRTSPLVLRNADLATLRGYVASRALRSTGQVPFARLAVFPNDAGGGVPFYVSYGDLSLSATDVLLRYTYTGDTNLDGLVNGLDLANFLEGFSTGATGWQNGDFNYDGVITPADYALLAPALAANLPSLGSPAHLPPGGSGAIPEPAAAGLLLLSAAGLTARRRRRVSVGA